MNHLDTKTLENVPRLGIVQLRELSGVELGLFMQRARRAALVEDVDLREEKATAAACWALTKALDTNPEVIDPAKVPLEAFVMLQREAFRLSKIDAPELENLNPGETYETYAEEAAENFSETPASSPGSD